MAHPFHQAPMADSGRAIIEADNSPTPDELESPRNESATNLAGESGWNKFFRGCCLVCCCMVVADDGRQRR